MVVVPVSAFDSFPAPRPNYFQLFGLEAEFGLDMALLTQRYRNLQRQFHPDRHLCASPQQRLEVERLAAEINWAFQELRDPVRRAEHLLLLQGVECQETAGSCLDPALLMEQLSMREELEELLAATTLSPERGEEVVNFSHHVDQLVSACQQHLAHLLAHRSWQEGRQTLARLKFLAKLQQEITNFNQKIILKNLQE